MASAWDSTTNYTNLPIYDSLVGLLGNIPHWESGLGKGPMWTVRVMAPPSHVKAHPPIQEMLWKNKGLVLYWLQKTCLWISCYCELLIFCWISNKGKQMHFISFVLQVYDLVTMPGMYLINGPILCKKHFNSIKTIISDSNFKQCSVIYTNWGKYFVVLPELYQSSLPQCTTMTKTCVSSPPLFIKCVLKPVLCDVTKGTGTSLMSLPG